MDSASSLPPTWRIVLAFLIAPFAAALAMALYQPLYNGLPNMVERIYQTTYTLCGFYAYPTTVILGIPAFGVLRHKVGASLFNCVVAGACIASLPWLALTLIPTGGSGFANGHELSVNGHNTLWGWIEEAKIVFAIAVAGSLAGAIFWLIAVAGAKNRVT
jgi:hypothetical protein